MILGIFRVKLKDVGLYSSQIPFQPDRKYFFAQKRGIDMGDENSEDKSKKNFNQRLEE